MRYVMLIYMEEKQFAALSMDERNRMHIECGAWHDELVKTGQSVGAVGLQPASTARSLRERGGKVMITDGPFAETKEVLGGLEILDCKDLDEALAIARRFPGLRAGLTVEVRPHVSGDTCVED